MLATSAEASALCQEHGYPLLAGMSLSYQALVAAARGEHDKTRALASQLASWGGPRRALILTQRACHARALDAAGRGDFETAYENAATVAPPGTLDYTPQGLWVLFDLARVHLTYGERLRRDRATSDARRHLSAAREIFNQLSAAPWVARASSELRATGQPAADDQRPDPGTLTPQQREIATLAAAGLTNKQIGERLYLSHRTVATHLYQILPKLGVTSRAALRDALSGNEDREEADR